MPATETAMSAVFCPDLGQRLVAGRGDVALGTLRAGSASAWACLIDLFGRRLGVLPGLVEDRPHLVGGPGHLLAMLGQRLSLSFRARSVSMQDVLEVLLPLCRAASSGFQANRPRSDEQHDEDDERPDAPGSASGFSRVDRRLRRHAVGLRRLRPLAPDAGRRVLAAFVGSWAGSRPRRRGEEQGDQDRRRSETRFNRREHG